MALLGLDLGTTYIKTGLFTEDGQPLLIARRQTPVSQNSSGYAYYEPEAFWQAVLSAIEEVILGGFNQEIRAVGIASMAESGLFVDIQSGEPLSPFLPWFDTPGAGQVAQLTRAGSQHERFLLSGIYPSFKVSLAKILWLRENGFVIEPGRAVWLSAADYLLYRLTGSAATDASLAGRTYAFRIDRREWDAEWLARLGLSAEIFPAVLPSGIPAGTVKGCAGIGLPDGTPAAVCGHDHICASIAVGLFEPGAVFDSMGTAETVTGLLSTNQLGEAEYRSGLSCGCHVFPGRLYWLGGLSTSGGSVDWLRHILADPQLEYSDLDSLLSGSTRRPGSLLFLPYLAGSGSPRTDAGLRGAFLGLDLNHSTADLYQAVLEGACCEMEYIREAGERITGAQLRRILAAGGGTANRAWMQIKADLTGCEVELSPVQEATLLGAAMLAGVGAGVYPDHLSALQSLRLPLREVIYPRPENREGYRRLYQSYCEVQNVYRKLWLTTAPGVIAD